MVIYPRGSARYKTGMSRLAKRYERETNAFLSMRHLADQAFSRAAGAPLVGGNSIRLLLDARENYPAWLDAIAAAQRYIHFESYIIHEDEVGWTFADAFIARAREGVHVRVIYDWLGGVGKTSPLVLEPPARRRRRSALLQSSATRFTARLVEPRSSQDAYSRRRGRLCYRSGVWTNVGGRAGKEH